MPVSVIHRGDPDGVVASALAEVLELFAHSGGLQGPSSIRVFSTEGKYFEGAGCDRLQDLGWLTLASSDGELELHARDLLDQAAEGGRHNLASGVEVVVVPSLLDRSLPGDLDDRLLPLRSAARAISATVDAKDFQAHTWGQRVALVNWLGLRSFPERLDDSVFASVEFLQARVMAYSGFDSHGARPTAFFRERLVVDLLLLATLSTDRERLEQVLPSAGPSTRRLFLPWSIRVETHADLRARRSLLAALLGSRGAIGSLPDPEFVAQPEPVPGDNRGSMEDLRSMLTGGLNETPPFDVSRFAWPDGPSRPDPRDLFDRIDEIGPKGRDGRSTRSWPRIGRIRWPFLTRPRGLETVHQQLIRGLGDALPGIRRRVYEYLEGDADARQVQLAGLVRDWLRRPFQDQRLDLASASGEFRRRCAAILEIAGGRQSASGPPSTPGLTLGSSARREADLLAQAPTVPSAGAAMLEAAAIGTIGLWLASLWWWTGVGLAAGLGLAASGPLLALWLRNRQISAHLQAWDDAREDWKAEANLVVSVFVRGIESERRERGPRVGQWLAAAVQHAERLWVTELRGLRNHLAEQLAETDAQLRARSAAEVDETWPSQPASAAPDPAPLHDVVRHHFSLLTAVDRLLPSLRVRAYDDAINVAIRAATQGASVSYETLERACEALNDAASASILPSATGVAARKTLVVGLGDSTTTPTTVREVAPDMICLPAGVALPAGVMVLAAIQVVDLDGTVP